MNGKKILSYTGILGALCYVLHDAAGGLLYPGYSHLRQAVSDLTAKNSPVLYMTRPLTAAYGILSILCCIVVIVLARKVRSRCLNAGSIIWLAMNLISTVGYSAFPLGGGNDQMHIVVTVLVVVSSIVSLVLFIAAGFRKRAPKHIGQVATVALLSMMAGAILTNVVPAEVFGVAERFSTYAAVLFTAYLGIWAGKSITE